MTRAPGKRSQPSEVARSGRRYRAGAGGSGGIGTDRIDLIGPAARDRWKP